MSVRYETLFHLMKDKGMTNAEIEKIVAHDQALRDEIETIIAEVEVE